MAGSVLMGGSWKALLREHVGKMAGMVPFDGLKRMDTVPLVDAIDVNTRAILFLAWKIICH